MDGEKLSQFLVGYGFPNDLIGSGPLWGSTAFGIELGIGIGAGFVAFQSVSSFGERRDRGNTRSALLSSDVDFRYGYEVVNGGRFRLAPFAGLGLGIASVELVQGRVESFDDLLNDSAGGRAYSFNNVHAHLLPGAELSYDLAEFEGNRASMHLVVTTRAQYAVRLGNLWTLPSGYTDLSDGPGFSRNGAEIWLGIGARFTPRSESDRTD